MAEGRGPHVGKGPKGYQRSDERIWEDVGDILERHPDIDASDIELQVSEGVVTLTGTVENRRVKRMVEDAIDAVPGVKDVSNQLRISEGRLNEMLNDFSARGTSPGPRGGDR
jgi:osmotically-inducible protein OsmY